MPRGVVCFLGFWLTQQSCEESWLSAAIVAPPQPKRQPPAIQIDTLIESRNRTTLFEKNNLIRLAVYPSMALFVEVGTRIKIVIKFQHFCNGRLVSLKS